MQTLITGPQGLDQCRGLGDFLAVEGAKGMAPLGFGSVAVHLFDGVFGHLPGDAVLWDVGEGTWEVRNPEMLGKL